MLNWPFFISNGWLPYRDFTMVHTPLQVLILTGFYNLVGFSTASLHLFGTILLLLTDFMVMLIIFKLSKSSLFALIGGLIFSFLAIAFEGNHVWFDSFLTPLFLIIFYLEYRFLQTCRKRFIFLAGIFSGLALLTKQTALYGLMSFIFIPGFLVYKGQRVKKIASVIFLYLLPVMIIGLTFIFQMIKLGVFFDFWKWGVQFIFVLLQVKGENLTPDVYFPQFREVAKLTIPITIVGLLLLKRHNRRIGLAVCWMFFSSLIIFPRFGFFHLQSSIAFFVLASVVEVASLKSKYLWTMIIIIAAIFPGISIFRRHLETGQSFLENETIEVSGWITQNFTDRSIYLLNSPQSVYFLTKKLPGIRPWVDQLSWNMAFHGENYIKSFRKTPPDLIIFQPYKPFDYQPKEVVKFVKENYRPIKSFPSGITILQKDD